MLIAAVNDFYLYTEATKTWTMLTSGDPFLKDLEDRFYCKNINMGQSHSTRGRCKPTSVLNIEKPKAPDRLEALETGNYSIKLQWTPVTPVNSKRLYGYLLEQSDAGKSKWNSVHPDLPVLSDDTTEWEVGDVIPYKVYDFCVKSAIKNKRRTIVSEGCYLEDIAAKEQYQPYPPRNLRITDIKGCSVTLTWLEPPKVKDVSPASYEYVIEKSPYIDDNTQSEWTECGRTTQRKCTVNIQNAGFYYLRVSTLNKDKDVKSLPQEMKDPEMRIHIKHRSPEPGQLERLEAHNPVHGVTPTSEEIGSIIYVISCHDISGLRELWMNYKLGNMEPFFQDLFSLGACLDPDSSDKELDIEINEKDFYACHQHLLLTCPTAKGFRVMNTENACSRANTRIGLSEDYPVHCKPLVYNTTCSRLDFLDPAMPANQCASRRSTRESSIVTTEMSPGTVQMSPGTVQTSTGTLETSPGTEQMSPFTVQMSPGTVEMSPGTTERSSGITGAYVGALAEHIDYVGTLSKAWKEKMLPDTNEEVKHEKEMAWKEIRPPIQETLRGIAILNTPDLDLDDEDLYMPSTSTYEGSFGFDEDLPSSIPSALEQYRDSLIKFYKYQVSKQQPVAYDEEFILDVEDTFTTMDILPYNTRRQAFDRKPLESIEDIFNPTLNPNCSLERPSRILLWGAPGIGKTTLIAKLLTQWSKREVLQRYDLVFPIALRNVERTQSLVDCIFDQLPESDVHMKEVLENYLRRSNRVLIILDGYDELKGHPEENHDIMKLLTGRLYPHASVLVTTRTTCTSDVIAKMKPDTRIEILGFSPDNAKSFILKYFEKQPSKGEELLNAIGPTILSTGIFSVPTFLHQVCLLWEDDNVTFSDKICPLYNLVVNCLTRRYWTKDKNPAHVDDKQRSIHGLEQLAFECLFQEKMVLIQEDVSRYCGGEYYGILVQLGLLKEQKSRSRTNPDAQYSFSHKTMQEYFAARHLSKKLTSGEATKGTMLHQFFPTARQVQTLSELLIFTCGIFAQKAEFVLDYLMAIHNTSDVQLVGEEFYNFFATGSSKKDWKKYIKLEDFASAEDLTHQFTGQWNDYPPVLLTYQRYIELYLLCCHESGLTAQFAEQVFQRNTIQFSGASPRVYGVLSHMIAEGSERMKKMEQLRLVNTQDYVLGSTLEELHKLSGLKELNLCQSRMGRHIPTCTIPKRLEPWFKYRGILKTSEDDMAKAPAVLGRQLPLLRSLKKLVIAWNDLGPEDMKELLPSIKELRNLEELSLSGNDLSGLGKDIDYLVAFLSKLKVFKVYFCQLTFAEIQMIASSLTEHCPDLELFDFRLNPIQPDESIWVGEREVDIIKGMLRDKTFLQLMSHEDQNN